MSPHSISCMHNMVHEFAPLDSVYKFDIYRLALTHLKRDFSSAILSANSLNCLVIILINVGILLLSFNYI